ncbi:hypothetical protein [Streptomyces sp. NPDC002580]|uniref:hypothetical protein n=1 Tax=Streptomyces sp. NPDC002580 TaxID=3364653 RepID=UPI0036C50FFD
MTRRTSRELMAWQPPVGWRELSGDQRRAHMEDHGMATPHRPSDWDTLGRDQRAAFRAWHDKIFDDTPEKRAATEREHRAEMTGWWLLMAWWSLCLLVALGILWGRGDLIEGVGMRIGLSVFVTAGYAFAIFVPMFIAKPTRSRD